MMIDHYKVLGLPSGEKARRLSNGEIRKAYKTEALKLHPDKRLSDPNAVAKFQQLQFSYELLINRETRKAFDDLLRAQQEEEKSRQESIRARQRQEELLRQQELIARRYQEDLRRRLEALRAGQGEEEKSRREDYKARRREVLLREEDLEERLEQEDLFFLDREKGWKGFLRKIEGDVNRVRANWRATRSN